jgi:hypothetical protein
MNGNVVTSSPSPNPMGSAAAIASSRARGLAFQEYQTHLNFAQQQNGNPPGVWGMTPWGIPGAYSNWGFPVPPPPGFGFTPPDHSNWSASGSQEQGTPVDIAPPSKRQKPTPDEDQDPKAGYAKICTNLGIGPSDFNVC